MSFRNIAGMFVLFSVLTLMMGVLLAKCYETPEIPEPVTRKDSEINIPPPATQVAPGPEWEEVEDVSSVLGLYASENGRMRIARGGDLYPWKLDYETGKLTDRALRCGFFNQVPTEDWRVAYCTGHIWPEKGPPYAVRLMLHQQKYDSEAIHVQVGDTLELYMRKAKQDEPAIEPSASASQHPRESLRGRPESY